MPKSPSQHLIEYLREQEGGEISLEVFDKLVINSERGDIPFDPRKAAQIAEQEGRILIPRNAYNKAQKILLRSPGR